MSAPNDNSFDWDAIVPPDAFMRVQHFAKWLSCTDKHVITLIKEGVIKVPKALQDSAPSGPAMRIPRASIVKFIIARSSLTKIRKQRKADRARRAKAKATKSK